MQFTIRVVQWTWARLQVIIASNGNNKRDIQFEKQNIALCFRFQMNNITFYRVSGLCVCVQRRPRNNGEKKHKNSEKTVHDLFLWTHRVIFILFFFNVHRSIQKPSKQKREKSIRNAAQAHYSGRLYDYCGVCVCARDFSNGGAVERIQTVEATWFYARVGKLYRGALTKHKFMIALLCVSRFFRRLCMRAHSAHKQFSFHFFFWCPCRQCRAVEYTRRVKRIRYERNIYQIRFSFFFWVFCWENKKRNENHLKRPERRAAHTQTNVFHSSQPK